MQSVIGQRQKERKRFEDKLHRLTAAIAALGDYIL